MKMMHRDYKPSEGFLGKNQRLRGQKRLKNIFFWQKLSNLRKTPSYLM